MSMWRSPPGAGEVSRKQVPQPTVYIRALDDTGLFPLPADLGVFFVLAAVLFVATVIPPEPRLSEPTDTNPSPCVDASRQTCASWTLPCRTLRAAKDSPAACSGAPASSAA